LATIFSDIAFFINFLAKKGEIIYITMGHFQDDNSEDGSFNSNQTAQLKSFVLGYFNTEQFFGPLAAKGTPLFYCNYNQIIASESHYYDTVYVTSPSSKIILVLEDKNTSPEDWFWPASLYSPPDASDVSIFNGIYVNTDSRSDMIQNQQKNSKKAKNPNTVDTAFALYLTLTPQQTIAVFLMIRAIQAAVVALAPAVFLIPIIGPIVGPPLLTFGSSLLVEILGNSVIAANYTSLKELTKSIYHGHDLADLMTKHFTGSEYAFPSFIYLDYYEKRPMINVDGKKVAQVVELAKSLTLGNVK
jgi:hypothetical protein